MRIIIHIGTPRTGSTFLQHFFIQNQELLLQENIFFPTTGLGQINETRGGRLAGHNDLLTALKTADDAFVNQFRQALEQSEAKNIILSCENFSLHPDTIQPLTFLLKNFDVQIIVYLRRQDNYLESLYTEFINGGWRKLTEEVDSFFYNHIGIYGIIERDYNQLLAPWSQAFSSENILVRPFEIQQFHNHDLVKDFFNATNLPWNNEYDYPKNTTKNISSDIQINKILLDLNRIPLERTYYQEALNLIFGEHFKTSSQAEKHFFSSPGLRHQIIQEYAEGNNLVARNYLARTNGKLFYDPEPDPDEPFTPFQLKDINLVSKLYSIFLMQFANEINDKLQESNDDINKQKYKIENHQGELGKHRSELDKLRAEVKILKGIVKKGTQAQQEAKKEINSLRKENFSADNLNRTFSHAIWLRARKKPLRRIKDFLRSEATLIRLSGLFDSQWYLKQYPKVAQSGIDPIRHYVKKGVVLGYNPSETFNTCLYIQHNIPVIMSGLNPLVSYIYKQKAAGDIS